MDKKCPHATHVSDLCCEVRSMSGMRTKSGTSPEMTLLSLLDQVGDHREVVAVAVDEGISLEGAVWSALAAALLTDEEWAIEDLHLPEAK